MANVNTINTITGAQSPSSFELDTLLAGAGGGNQGATQSFTAPTATRPTLPALSASNDGPTALDMQSELATIQALSQGASSGGGIAQTIGQTAGSLVSPEVGGIAGGVGSIIDWYIDKEDRDAAQAKREKALIDEKSRQIKIGNSNAATEARTRRVGIALSREEQALTKEDVIRNDRKNALRTLLGGINQKAQQDEVLKQKFLTNRRIA